MKTILWLVIIISWSSHELFGQTPLWLNTINGAGKDHTYGVDKDINGNIIVCGRFTGTVDFDPSPGIFNLTSNGLTDCYLAKYTAYGDLLWAFGIGSTEKDAAIKVKVNNSNEILVAGCFRNNTDFDPGPGTFLMNGNGLSGTDNLDIPGGDIFLAKYSITGNFIWAFMIGGSYLHDKPEGLDVDDNDNIYLAGAVNGTSTTAIDADPGLGLYDLGGQGNAFVAKYTTNANFIWAFNYGGYGLNSGVDEIRVLPNDTSFILSGFFNGTNVDFDPSPSMYFRTTNGAEDFVIGKYSQNGNLIWVYSNGGPSADVGQDIDFDINNNIYVTGWYSGMNIDFDPSVSSTSLMSSNGLFDVFVLKYTNSGIFVWSKSFGQSANDIGFCMNIVNNEVIIGGQFGNTVDFDPGPLTFNLSSNGLGDIFITTLDTSGNFICASSIGGSINDHPFEMIPIDTTSFILTGRYSSMTVDFDPTINTLVKTNSGQEDGFFGKYSFDTNSPNIQFSVVGDTVCSSQVPTITINSNPSISGNFSVTYTLNGVTYTSTNIVNGVPFSIATSINSTSQVVINSITLNNANSCNNSVIMVNLSTIILLFPPITIPITGTPNPLCAGQFITLTASGAQTFNWTNGVVNGVPFIPNGSNTYSVIGTDANGCTGSSSISVMVNPLPNIIASANPNPICLGQSTTLTATGATNYVWSNGVINGVPFIPTSSTNYSVVGTDANGCSNQTNITLQIIEPSPIAIVNVDPILCKGDTILLTANGAVNYTWEPSSNLLNSNGSSVLAVPTTNTNYTVVGIDINGCSISATIHVQVIDDIKLQLTKSGDLDCGNTRVILTASGAHRYIWEPANVLNQNIGSTVTAEITDKTIFYCTGSIGSCSTKDSIIVDIINKQVDQFYIPNAFTPNYDGINDCFRIFSNNNYTEYYLTVYNRWGQKVYESTDPMNCWEGYFQNLPVEAGTYYYYFKGKNNCGNVFKKGDVIVVR